MADDKQQQRWPKTNNKKDCLRQTRWPKTNKRWPKTNKKQRWPKTYNNKDGRRQPISKMANMRVRAAASCRATDSRRIGNGKEVPAGWLESKQQ